MHASTRFRPVAGGVFHAALTLLCASLCAPQAHAQGGSESYLPAGPLPVARRPALRATPALPPSAAARPAVPAASAPSGIPAGFSAAEGTGPLPGATMPGIGPVRGLVVPVSLGPRVPAHDDAALTRDLFGDAPGASAPTLVERMHAASGGLFRPSFEVLPTMIESRAGALPAAPTPRQLMAFARAALRGAAERADLSRFDDDGPDGIPASSDDDGRLDFLVLVVETDAPFPSVTLREDFTIPTPRGPVASGPVHVLSLGRDEALDAGPALGLWLDGLGLEPGERFFPAAFPRAVSSLARARLGWLPLDLLREAGTLRVADGRAAFAPLQDLAAGAGAWLVERDGDHLFVSRVARAGDGRFLATETHVVRRGEGQVLPLSRQLGERGSRVVLRWPEGGEPEAERITVAARPADPVPLRRTGGR